MRVGLPSNQMESTDDDIFNIEIIIKFLKGVLSFFTFFVYTYSFQNLFKIITILHDAN